MRVPRAVGCADLMTLDTMTPQERKRQGYIHELIQTEETYVDDLELVLEVQTDTHRHIQRVFNFSSEYEPLGLLVEFHFSFLRSSTSQCLSQAV